MREALDSSTPNEETSMSGSSQQQMSGNANAPHFLAFDMAEYARLVLVMIMSNSLPFSLADSEFFPIISRSTLRTKLTEIYEAETLNMKEKFAANTSSFALTIDEWRSSNDYDFLRITLHFYNNSGQKEKYTIGFEDFDKHLSYTGKVLYDSLMKVSRDFGIEGRIISITRNNTGPMNCMMDHFRSGTGLSEIDFHGDIQCLEHVLKLSAETFMEITYFKKSPSKKFETSVGNMKENPAPERISSLPKAMRFIILRIRHNHEIKNAFLNLVETKKEKKKESTTRGPDTIILGENDPRWLSTYKMIDRFIYFREDITKVLRFALRDKTGSATDRVHFEITDHDWSYLTSVRDILEQFQIPTLRLQAKSHPAIHQTISLVYGTLCGLDSAKVQRIGRSNPYLAMGLDAAKCKLSEYFPIYNEDIISNKMLYVAVVLEPRFKLAVFECNGFTERQIEAIKNAFVDVYKQYKRKYGEHTDECAGIEDDSTSMRTETRVFGFGFANRASEVDSETEIENYLTEPREPEDEDPFAFYMSRKTIYPILYRMARDYFAVPAMSAPTESLFSPVGDIVPKKRNRLSPGSLKMLAILNSQGVVDIEVCTDDELENEEVAEGDICGSEVGVDDGLLLIDYSKLSEEDADELELLALDWAV
ncbi:hypothetical protein OXX59_006381 [Metschnikowia pulcherrima]